MVQQDPNLTPEFLAEDGSQVLLNVTIALTILTTLVFILFITSRTFCAERNTLEIWILPVCSYICCAGLWTIGFCELPQH